MARGRGSSRVVTSAGQMLNPRITVLAALVTMAAGLLAVAAFTPAAALGGLHGDVALYFEVGERLARGELPYRDFPSEYPPLALVPIALARFLPSPDSVDLGTFAARMALLNIGLAVVGFVLATWLAGRGHSDGWRRAAVAGATFAAGAVVLGSLVIWRYDIFPAVLSTAALALLVAGRPASSGLALGAAVAAKLYATPLLVLFVGWHAAWREWTEAVRLAAGFALVGAVLLVPFGLGQLDLTFLRYQLERGLQIESVPAGIVGLAHLLGVGASSNVGFGSIQVESALSGPLLAAFGVVAPIVVGLVLIAGLVRLWQARDGGDEMVSVLAAFCTAVLLAVIATNKVLSPQYLIWLLPFAPMLTAVPRWLTLAGVVLTAIVFPTLYPELVALEPIPIVLLNLRNAVLVAALAWLMAEQWPLVRTVIATRRAPTALRAGTRAAEAGH